MESVVALMTFPYVSHIITINNIMYSWYNIAYPIKMIFLSNPGWLSYFCPLIQIYRNANAIPDGEHPCLYVFGMCTILHQCYGRNTLRGEIRRHKNISGSAFEDWMWTTCCFSPSLIQESLVQLHNAFF